VIGTSLPVFVAGGIHDLQAWNERVCNGAWGRLGRRSGEKLRRELDLDHWPAFGRSFGKMVELLAALGKASNTKRPATNATNNTSGHNNALPAFCNEPPSASTVSVSNLMAYGIEANTARPQMGASNKPNAPQRNWRMKWNVKGTRRLGKAGMVMRLSIKSGFQSCPMSCAVFHAVGSLRHLGQAR
jgi:hypothetical protein